MTEKTKSKIYYLALLLYALFAFGVPFLTVTETGREFRTEGASRLWNTAKSAATGASHSVLEKLLTRGLGDNDPHVVLWRLNHQFLGISVDGDIALVRMKDHFFRTSDSKQKAKKLSAVVVELFPEVATIVYVDTLDEVKDLIKVE